MKKRLILVTGGKGIVASYISSVFPEYKIILAGKSELDITNKKQVFEALEKWKPFYIIHLAGKTNVDECQKHKREATRINYSGTRNIALACKKIDSTLIYLSTSAIFNGKEKGYYENSIPNPINHYGKTKLRGEMAIKQTIKKYYIIRSGWIIGGGIKQKKFVSFIVQQLRDNKKEIKAVDDKFGTLAYAKDVAEFIKRIISEKPYGVYHYGSKGICSRFMIAKRIITLLDKTAHLIPVKSESFSDRFFAKRPTYEVLKSRKIPFSKSWQESLDAYILDELAYET